MDTEKSISVRIKSRAGANLIRGQYRHDLRKGRVPEYVDQARSHRNSHVTLAEGYSERPGELIKEFNERLTAAKKNRRTAEVRVGVVTLSKGAQTIVEGLSVADQDNLFEHVVKRVAADMDVPANYFEVHRDETGIHAHFSLLNVTSKGRPFRGGRGYMSHLQDVAGQACQELGYDIKRGKPKIARIKDGEDPSKWTHRSVAKLHKDLPQEIAALETERDALAEKNRVTGDRLAEAETKLDETLPADIAKEERRLAEVREKIRRAEIDFDDMDMLIFKTKFKIKETEDELEKVEQRRVTAEEAIASLERQRNALAEKVKTTEERLAKAEQKLQALDGENERLLKRSQTYAQRLQSQREAMKDVEDRLTLLAENQRLQAANKDLQQRLLRYERGRGQRGPGR